MLRRVLQQLVRARSSGHELAAQGRLARQSFKWEEAAAFFQEALRREPHSPEVLAELGNAFAELGDADSAVHALKKSLVQDPKRAHTRAFLAAVLRRCGERSAAREEFERAVADEPSCGPARSGLLLLLMDQCDWPGVERQYAEVRALQKTLDLETWLRLICPYESLLLPYTHAERLAIARAHATDAAASVTPDLNPPTRPSPCDRLKVAYLSGDFRDHAVGHLTPALFELHDSSGFEITAYSYGADDSSVYRKRIATAADRFVEIRNESVVDSAARVRRDGIHILIDLGGHTAGNRLAICAARAAPIQMHYLGFPGTIGAEFLDYFITDSFVSPPGQESRFSECLLRLAPTFLVGDPAESSAGECSSRAAERLPEEGVVLCCFNRYAKVTPTVFEAWMRILKAVPQAVLWLMGHYPEVQHSLSDAAERSGVKAKRLVFAKELPDKRAHLARHQLADLFLDTFGAYNAHTTASDALWAGLPVLTCTSDQFPGRVAGSLLTSAALPELITESPEHYVAQAVRIASSRSEIDRLRRSLANNRHTARFFDVRALVNGLEDAYREAWRLHVAGERPRAFTT